MKTIPTLALVAAATTVLLVPCTSWADDTQPDASSASAPAEKSSFWTRDTLLGDLGGVRPALEEKGITLGLQDTEEYWRDTSGGLQRGGSYLGQTLLTLNADTGKALGWPGGTFFMSGLQIHGHENTITDAYVGSLQTASNIEARRTTRLWELWWQQSFLDGKADVRVGQQAADQEFMVSEYGAPFINAMFGWPALPSADLPGGGPAYPLSALGLRVRYKASDSITLRGGVYNGTFMAHPDDAQQWDRHGTRFRLGDPPLFIAELQYDTHPASAHGEADGLPGHYKIGVWYHAGSFADQRYDTNGLSLADPASNGTPASHHGDYSLYAMVDQALWQKGARSVGVFARAMVAPGDRNPVDFSADAGIALTGPFSGRSNDVLGIGLGYARIGGRARGLDRDGALLDGAAPPARTAETFVEATYKYQIAPWWSLQADAQYFIRPGGGAPDPASSGQRIRNAFIVGVRTTLTF